MLNPSLQRCRFSFWSTASKDAERENGFDEPEQETPEGKVAPVALEQAALLLGVVLVHVLEQVVDGLAAQTRILQPVQRPVRRPRLLSGRLKEETNDRY